MADIETGVGGEKRYRFIHFVEIERKAKTSVFSCRNNRSGEELGQVRWYPAWRRYCYFPTVQAIYSAGCLADIQHFMEAVEKAR